MKRYRDNTILKFLNIISELVILFVSFYISGHIRGFLHTDVIKAFGVEDINKFVLCYVLVSVFGVLVYLLAGNYSSIHTDIGIKGFLSIFTVQCMAGFTCSGFLYLSNGQQFSRVWICLYVIVSTILIYIKRVIADRWARKFVEKSNLTISYIVIGDGYQAKQYVKTTERVKKWCSFLGYVTDENIEERIGSKDKLPDVIRKCKPQEVIIIDNDLTKTQLNSILATCATYGSKAFIVPIFDDYMMGVNNVEKIGNQHRFPISAEYYNNILGVKIAATNMNKTIEQIRENLDAWRGQYICVSNVHTTIMAHDNAEYMKVQNGSVMSLPDGGPLSAYSRAEGLAEAQRVTGPDLMSEILSLSGEYGWKHFFYGSSQETLDKLKKAIEEKYPKAEIVGMISPPFRTLTYEEDKEYVETINKAKPDFLWVGLGAPKQENYMAAHKGIINALMIGVGAAFDYESGNIKRAPMWMQKCSLEWLYRLMQDPKRLLKRYLVTNVKYLWLTRK